MFSSDFMRPEVWHALSVHFPIALLPVATIAMAVSFFLRDSRRHWQIAATLLLFAGCLMSWVAVYTGGVADGIVARKICDPTILKDHEISGEKMTWIFTAALPLSIALLIDLTPLRIRQILPFITLLIMLTGTGYLIYTGHVGASLVYDQGAGVRNHTVDCDEYR